MKKAWLAATVVLLAVPMIAQPVGAAKKAAPKAKANNQAPKRAPSAFVEPAPHHVAGSPYEGAAPAAPGGPLDRLVFGKLEELGLGPANLCSDGVFVRRAYLDTIGTLPTAQEVRTFLVDQNPNKRRILIDRLLAREEFADYWAMKWSDLLRVKSEFPINLWPNAVQAYHRWIRTCLKENLPYDKFVREMLTASGSNFRVPQVNFYRAVQSREPSALAQAAALTFMGVRPEAWPKEKWSEMAVFFSQVSYKSTLEWKEEIVMFDPNHAAQPARGVADPQRPAAVLPDGTKIQLAPDQDPRVVFADWLIDAKNPWFARNIVNRIWSWLLGRGIIHEPDDIRPDNPPSDPKLLAYLEREFVASQYDLKRIYRLILTSQTYQLSSMPKTDDPRASVHFAFYPVRRLEAEVLIDALCQITGTTEQYSSPIPEPFTFIPEDARSIALADASITSSFLENFGRSPRDTGREAERNNRPTAAQRLHLLNSSHIQRKIEQSGKLQYLLQGKGQPRDVIDDLYLTILSRFPTQEELKVVAALFQSAGTNRRGAAVDLVWALINSAEFLHRH
ncbi:MAG: DUF1553 domain-containing protein [Planctomycetes bacterium]|nr:DUF1553 domain-containing protein [Planctomycetota bacterium]